MSGSDRKSRSLQLRKGDLVVVAESGGAPFCSSSTATRAQYPLRTGVQVRARHLARIAGGFAAKNRSRRSSCDISSCICRTPPRSSGPQPVSQRCLPSANSAWNVCSRCDASGIRVPFCLGSPVRGASPGCAGEVGPAVAQSIRLSSAGGTQRRPACGAGRRTTVPAASASAASRARVLGRRLIVAPTRSLGVSTAPGEFRWSRRRSRRSGPPAPPAGCVRGPTR